MFVNTFLRFLLLFVYKCVIILLKINAEKKKGKQYENKTKIAKRKNYACTCNFADGNGRMDTCMGAGA